MPPFNHHRLKDMNALALERREKLKEIKVAIKELLGSIPEESWRSEMKGHNFHRNSLEVGAALIQLHRMPTEHNDEITYTYSLLSSDREYSGAATKLFASSSDVMTIPTSVQEADHDVRVEYLYDVFDLIAALHANKGTED